MNRGTKMKKFYILLCMLGIGLLIYSSLDYINEKKPEIVVEGDKDVLPTVKKAPNSVIKGSTMVQKVNPELKNSQYEINGYVIDIVDSFNQDPPWYQAGVWQGDLDFSLKQQIFIVAHNGVLPGDTLFMLKEGSTFRVKDKKGVERTYEVKYTRDLNDYGEDTAGVDHYKDTVDSKEDRMVLQTCYNDDLNYMIYAYPIS